MSTKNYVIADSTGLVVGSAIVPDADIQLQQAPEGCTLHIGIHARPFMDRIVDGEVVPVTTPEPTLAERKAGLISRLAERRWEIETGGFEFRGKVVRSDADSQAKVNALMTGIALLGDSFTTSWKCQNGWLKLDAAGAKALVAAGLTHVSSCFAREGELAEAINAATEQDLPALAETVEAFWP